MRRESPVAAVATRDSSRLRGCRRVAGDDWGHRHSHRRCRAVSPRRPIPPPGGLSGGAGAGPWVSASRTCPHSACLHTTCWGGGADSAGGAAPAPGAAPVPGPPGGGVFRLTSKMITITTRAMSRIMANMASMAVPLIEFAWLTEVGVAVGEGTAVGCGVAVLTGVAVGCGVAVGWGVTVGCVVGLACDVAVA